MTRARKPVGRITFVGAGPGDPELLTTRAVRALETAEIVIAASDVPAAVTSLAPVPVTPPAVSVADTAKALLTEARNGCAVVRVVAGDPFTDELAVKEALAIAKTAVPFEVVPGVPTGLGTAAYAGVPAGALFTGAQVDDVHAADYDAL